MKSGDNKKGPNLSQGRSTPWSLGMGNLQPLIGNPYNGYIFTPTIGFMTIPYYMEIMGV